LLTVPWAAGGGEKLARALSRRIGSAHACALFSVLGFQFSFSSGSSGEMPPE